MPVIPEHIDVSFPDDVGCYGCSSGKNPQALGLRFRREGERIVGETALAGHLSGGPGVAHGGIVALVLDEYSCAAAYFLRDTIVVTGELSVRYEGPCPVERPIRVEAWIVDESHPRFRVIEAAVFPGDRRVARSTGKFFPAPALSP